MSKVIFLDVDGVLNKHYGPHPTKERSPMGFIGVDKKYLENLRDLVKETNAEIVLISDWKDGFTTMDCNPKYADKDGQYLVRRFADYGLCLTARTNDASRGLVWSSGRGLGIREYLSSHPEVEEYVILDDNQFSDFTGSLLDHFVYCEEPFGKQNLKKAIKILNGENNDQSKA